MGMAREKLAGNVSKGSVRLFSLNQNHPLRAVNSNAASASQSYDLPHKLWHKECMKAASLQTKISGLGFVSDGFLPARCGPKWRRNFGVALCV